MAVPNFTPSPVQGISGPGPYAVTHAYEAGDIGVLVLCGSERVELSEAEFRLIPPASPTGGELLLAPEVAERHAGGVLIAFRESRIAQGWDRRGDAHGLEAQLDLIVRALQDQTRRLDAALRLDMPVAPLHPVAGRPLIGTDGGGMGWGSTTVETAETAAALLGEGGVIATPVPWPGKAEFLAAPLNPATRTARVLADGLELVYLRDPEGATLHADGSRWRLAAGADYPSVARLRAARHAFDPGDRIRAGGFDYLTLAADQTADLTTQGGTALRVEPDRAGVVDLDAFGAAGDGQTDDTGALTRAIARGRVRLGPRAYAVNEIQPVSGMQIEGPGGDLQGGRYGLVCTAKNGAIFRDRSDKPIYSVHLEGFYADARAPGAVFYDSPSQTKYSGSFRIRRLDISNEFRLLFRCVPIYWLIDDCRFGFFGGRQGGGQEFRIFEAWANSTAVPINVNKVTNTTHYHCAAGKEFPAAYTLRCGMSWTFENCTAERFDAPVVETRSFAALYWLGGWIEAVTYPTMFRSLLDRDSPFVLDGSPFVIEGTKFYIGNKTCRTLVENRNGRVTLKDLHISGLDRAFRAVTHPGQVALYRNVFHNRTPSLDLGVIEQEQSPSLRLSPWRNGIDPDRLAVLPARRAATLAQRISGLSGEQTSRIEAGGQRFAILREVPPALLARYWNGQVTLVGVGAWEGAGSKERIVRAACWIDAGDRPSLDKPGPVAPEEQGLSRADTGLASTRVTCFVPRDPKSFHIGLIFEGHAAGEVFTLEGLHILGGDVICDYPFFA